MKKLMKIGLTTKNPSIKYGGSSGYLRRRIFTAMHTRRQPRWLRGWCGGEQIKREGKQRRKKEWTS